VSQDQLDAIGGRLRAAQEDLGPSGPLNVLVYADLDALVEGYGAYIGRGPAQDSARSRYSSGGVAESGSGFMLIWLPNFRNSTAREQSRTLFHEYYHTLQNFLIGATRSSQVNNVSPEWLTEGTADYFSSRFTEAQGFVNDYAQYRSDAIRQTRSANALSTYEQRPDPNSASPPAAYRLGALATEYLDSRFGTDSVRVTFWQNVKAERDWRRAFTKTFGLSLDEFYAAFETFRGTL
jgi:hypothetical protein